MSDAGDSGVPDEDDPGLLAHECGNGHLTYPAHTRCPDCGAEQTGTVDLSEREAEVLTWTTVGASPTGVREPNTLAVVEFAVDDRTVRAIGQTTGDVEVGDTVSPVYVDRLRDPEASIRARESQSWDGYRFAPVE
jgi:uncharacterized OB-fold protein